jgi:hypothetical protein
MLALLLIPCAILAVPVGLKFRMPSLVVGGGVTLILVVPALCWFGWRLLSSRAG